MAQYVSGVTSRGSGKEWDSLGYQYVHLALYALFLIQRWATAVCPPLSAHSVGGTNIQELRSRAILRLCSFLP